MGLHRGQSCGVDIEPVHLRWVEGAHYDQGYRHSVQPDVPRGDRPQQQRSPDGTRDGVQVHSGEDRFCVASHPQAGERLALRLTADPYNSAAQVLHLPDLPVTVDHPTVSSVPNTLGFAVARAGTDTVHDIQDN